jgi:hypothetical protein
MSEQQISTRQTLPVSRSGLELRTLDDMWRFATCLAKSGLAPKGIESPEAIVIALQLGMELGLPPMGALQNIAVINGRPSIWGDAMLAVVRATGDLEQFEEWFEQGGQRIDRTPSKFDDDTTSVCHVKRRGSEPLPDVAFSVADAKRAGLWGKQGPWSQYPARMLKFRSRAFSLRDAFGDALRGMLSTEEAQDVTKEVKGSVVEPARPKLFSPPADTAESAVLGGSADGGDVAGTEPPAPAAPKRGRPRKTPPPAEPPEPPPFALDDAPETTQQALRRRVQEAGVNFDRFEFWLAANNYPPLSMLAESEASEVLERFDDMVKTEKEEEIPG